MVIKYEYGDTEIKNIVSTIIDEEFMLSSDILSDSYFIYKLEELGIYPAISFFAKMFCNGIIFWIIFMIFALFTNGGIECDCILLILIILSFCFALANKNATYFKLACRSCEETFKNKDVFRNTMKEAKWLAKEIRKCEKEPDLRRQRKKYKELVKIMDEKYGKRRHALAMPLSEVDAARKSYWLALYRNLIFNINAFETGWNSYCMILNCYKDPSSSCKVEYNYMIKTITDMLGYGVFPSIPQGHTEEVSDYFRKKIMGNSIWNFQDGENIGIETLLEMRLEKIRNYKLFNINFNNYYNEKDITCLEGKLLYELLLEEQNNYPISIETFKLIDRNKYNRLCKAVEKNGYTKEDLIDEIDYLKNIIHS